MRIDLNKGTADILISEDELAERRAALEQGRRLPVSGAARRRGRRSSAAMVDQLADGMVLKPAVKYQRVAQTCVPRDNH